MNPANCCTNGGLSPALQMQATDGRVEAMFAPLRDGEHRSAKREQGAHVRAQGRASSRRPAWREKRSAIEPTRCRRDRHARRNGFRDFCRNKSRPLAREASGKKTGMSIYLPSAKVKSLGSGFRRNDEQHARHHCCALLGSRIQRSPSNPALGFLPRAFASSADAIQGIG